MIELSTKVRLLDAIGAQAETGIVVGRTCESEPHYDIRVDGPRPNNIRINVPADRVAVE